MTDTKTLPLQPGASPREAADGRRLRSERSRAQIVEALLALIHEGDMSPSAVRVAERAKVGLRTVFRHFEDMDSLYVEMAAKVAAEVLPKVFAPYTAQDWRGQFFEHVRRRFDIYDHVMPVRVSANVRRFQSPFLMQEYARNLMIERTSLQAILPEEVRADIVLFAAIEAAAGFQFWRRLRMDQDLSTDQAAGAVVLTLQRLLGP